MNINNVWERLQAGIQECENGSENHLKQHLWTKGMGDGFKMALRILAENGLTPQEPVAPQNNDIIPFPHVEQ